MDTFTVADVMKGRSDSTGAPIEEVYTKVPPLYAVYATDRRVVIQYADDLKLASDQRQALIGLNPIKGEINGLIDGWRSSADPKATVRASLYDRGVADALEVGLEGDAPDGIARLAAVKTALVAERTAIARAKYLWMAAITAAVTMALFWLLWRFDVPAKDRTWIGFATHIWASAGIGALGAFFSIALGISSRQVSLDIESRNNIVDSILRIVIGTISAGILYCMLRSGLVDFSFGGSPTIGNELGDTFYAGMPDPNPESKSFSIAIVIAFAAGFSERLVGDMLSKAILGATPDSLNAAPAGPKPAPAAKGDARNPLGVPPPAAAPAGAPAAPTPGDDDEDHLEGCCDHGTPGTDAQTQDVELPEATGGVAGKGGGQ